MKAWLFEHFSHPYPSEDEKLALASRTGLTPTQIANWFINARVRIWRPMVDKANKEHSEPNTDNKVDTTAVANGNSKPATNTSDKPVDNKPKPDDSSLPVQVKMEEKAAVLAR